jgi:6-phosphogluconolactonase (cycloisomerase 2 family)/enamine deaminase RidA (YjgF/YER057c/UK114 family)
MPAILLFLFHSLLQIPIVDTAYELIIGSYTREGNPGIEIMDVNTLRNRSVPRYTIQNPNSSFLAVSADRSRMFSVREEGQAKSAVAAFRRNARGEYEFVNSSPVIGSGPCHVAYREASATVYAANYGSGSLSVFKTVDGKLEPIAQHIKYKGSGPDKSRQEGSHAHQVTVSPDQHFLYVTDLGGDKVYRHRIYADGLVDEDAQVINVAPGSGPRHLVFNSKGDHMYLINEMNAMVDVFLVRQDAFTLLQSILADTARSPSKGSGDIHLSPDGRWLLTSNRISSNEITVFEVQGDGTLKKVRHQPVLKKPRNFNFTPDGKFVYVASQDEHKVQVFAFNGTDGSMTDTGRDILVKNPVCLIFLPREDVVNPEERISSLKIRLIQPSAPIANYVKYVQVGNLVFLSGHGPDKPEGGQVFGKLGKDLSVEQGQEAARLTGISLISTLRGLIGDLNHVKRIVKVTGLVNCVDTFTQQPAVMNGFSNLMVDVFGDRGRHARTSVGVNALPNNIAVEIEMVVELK